MSTTACSKEKSTLMPESELHSMSQIQSWTSLQEKHNCNSFNSTSYWKGAMVVQRTGSEQIVSVAGTTHSIAGFKVVSAI